MRINKARNIKSGIKIWVEDSHTLTPAGTLNSVDITPAGSIGGTTISVNQMPAHDHEIVEYNTTSSSNPIAWSVTVAKQQCTNTSDKVINRGGSQSHGHSWTGTKNTHNHTFTGTAFSFDNNPPYKTVYCFYRVS